ncbi:PepSY domain-containing protein [Micromonospora sp. NPDC002389]|uniref:PepSY domain-containing protein n=1 Tax=Micromonospora sp. NPDC002389 TaxID=3154272 RepID=UPI00331D3AF4
MKRNPLILASVGGAAAVLAAAGIFLGVTAADNDRARQTTLTAATGAPDETTPAAPDTVTPPTDPGTVAPPTDPGSVAPPTDPTTATPPAGTGSPDATDKISRERAGEIALAHAGGGRITEIDRDRENKRPVWEVEIVKGDVEHEIDVDRETGQVLKAEQERYDGDDDDRDDDDDDDDDDDRDDD